MIELAMQGNSRGVLQKEISQKQEKINESEAANMSHI